MTNDTPQRVARGAKRHGSRYKARRRAVDLLFEGEARDKDPVELAHERNRLAVDPDNQVAPVNDYTITIVDGVAVQLDAIDDVIERYLTDDWELYRIPAVDRAILRLSVWELLFNPDVPQKTAVVEGTELASQYSGDKAASYINAMLDRVRGDVDQLRVAVSIVVPDGDDTPAPSEDADVTPEQDASAEAAPAVDDALVVDTTDGAEPTAGDNTQVPEPDVDTTTVDDTAPVAADEVDADTEAHAPAVVDTSDEQPETAPAAVSEEAATPAVDDTADEATVDSAAAPTDEEPSLSADNPDTAADDDDSDT